MAVKLPAMRKEKEELLCQRCNSPIPRGMGICLVPTIEGGLLMKRVRSDQALYPFSAGRFSETRCS